MRVALGAWWPTSASGIHDQESRMLYVAVLHQKFAEFCAVHRELRGIDASLEAYFASQFDLVTGG